MPAKCPGISPLADQDPDEWHKKFSNSKNLFATCRRSMPLRRKPQDTWSECQLQSLNLPEHREDRVETRSGLRLSDRRIEDLADVLVFDERGVEFL